MRQLHLGLQCVAGDTLSYSGYVACSFAWCHVCCMLFQHPSAAVLPERAAIGSESLLVLARSHAAVHSVGPPPNPNLPLGRSHPGLQGIHPCAQSLLLSACAAPAPPRCHCTRPHHQECPTGTPAPDLLRLLGTALRFGGAPAAADITDTGSDDSR
jgi:hypothetical protein